jgi:hypothetical protein
MSLWLPPTRRHTVLAFTLLIYVKLYIFFILPVRAVLGENEKQRRYSSEKIRS